VLVIGGGDGGAAREVFLASGDKKVEVEIVEIDPMVIETSKRFLPRLSSALPMVRVTVGDGFDFVRTSGGKRDIMIVDSTDPTPLAEGLFSDEFYRDARELCDVFVAQTESPIANKDTHKRAVSNMKRAFEHVYTYYACIPTYPGSLFSFTLGLKKELGKIRDLGVEAKYYSRERFLASMGDFSKWIMK
jgi:spermidine synthase